MIATASLMPEGAAWFAQPSSQPSTVRFSQNGVLIAAVTGNAPTGTVLVFDAATGFVLGQVSGAIGAVFTADGSRLFVGNENAWGAIWDTTALALPLDQLRELACAELPASQHAFSPEELAADQPFAGLWGAAGPADRPVCSPS
jgi:DNA-binding beta-propeller fold protein YncE